MNVYDIETYSDKGKVIPYCVCAIINNKKIAIYYEEEHDLIIESFIKIIKNYNKNKIVVYVHNINFDGMIILQSLFKNNIIFSIIKRELNIYKISFEYLGCSFEFKCSYKLLPLSLKKLSSFTSLNKLNFPYKFAGKEHLFYIGPCPDASYFEKTEDYELFKNKTFDFKNESIKYCMRDVEALKNILDEISTFLFNINKKMYKIFRNSHSIPSFSNKCFYNLYNKFNIDKRLDMDLYNYIKLAYYGGRCEIFGNPNKFEYTHYFDFSGMYGQCMMEKFPIGTPEFSLSNNDPTKLGFHHIKFKSNCEIPVLPIHLDGKLMFCNGEMEGLYWSEEIKKFIENEGRIIKINYSLLYEKDDYVFHNFVENFNKLRIEGGYKKTLGKLIINSLYGSFGMKLDTTFTIITFSDKEFEDVLINTNVKSYTKTNNCYLIEIIKDHKSNKLFNKNNSRWNNSFHERNVAYACIIAAKSRIKLYSALKDSIKNGFKLLYCDTDSVFASNKINSINKTCGDHITWSEVYDDSCFILPKFYALKKGDYEDIKIKGISNKDIKFNDLCYKFYNNHDKLTLDNQLTIFKKKFELKQEYINKIIWLNKYDKRTFSNNKKETSPKILNMSDSHPFKQIVTTPILVEQDNHSWL